MNKWNNIAGPGLYSQHGQLLLFQLYQQYSEWDLCETRHLIAASPRWACIGVCVSWGVHIYLYLYIYVYMLLTILELQSLFPKLYWQMEAPAVSAEQCDCQHDMCKKHKGAVVFFIWVNNSLLTINWKKCLGTLLSLLAQPGAGVKCWGNRSHVLSGAA